MTNIKWYNLNEQGYIMDNNTIIRPLSSKPCIYVYKLSNQNKLYIGSTVNATQRFRQHKYRAEMHRKNLIYNTKFYNYVAKYGWLNFKFGIIEYVTLNDNSKWQNKKEKLLRKEQYYLDLYSPCLNINRTAGSMFGYKHEKNLNIKLEFDQDQFQIIHKTLYKKPLINEETLWKLKLHNKSITVSIYTKENELIKCFNRIKTAAEFVGLSPSSVSGYIKNGKLWNNLYYFKLKTNTIINNHFPLNNNIKENISTSQNLNVNLKSYSLVVFNNDKIIYQFKSVREASLYLNISKVTLMKYSVEGKLWRDKYKFKILY